MPRLDDILQVHLEALETGVPLDSVLGEVPERFSELSKLIQLAAAIREHPVPEPSRSCRPQATGWRALRWRLCC